MHGICSPARSQSAAAIGMTSSSVRWHRKSSVSGKHFYGPRAIVLIESVDSGEDGMRMARLGHVRHGMAVIVFFLWGEVFRLTLSQMCRDVSSAVLG